jgi:hypothetical protein
MLRRLPTPAQANTAKWAVLCGLVRGDTGMRAPDGPRRVVNDIVPKMSQPRTTTAEGSIGELDGLPEDLVMASPAQVRTEKGQPRLAATLDTLSEFLGAQYSVFEGCRLVAEGEV